MFFEPLLNFEIRKENLFEILFSWIYRNFVLFIILKIYVLDTYDLMKRSLEEKVLQNQKHRAYAPTKEESVFMVQISKMYVCPIFLWVLKVLNGVELLWGHCKDLITAVYIAADTPDTYELCKTIMAYISTSRFRQVREL